MKKVILTFLAVLVVAGSVHAARIDLGDLKDSGGKKGGDAFDAIDSMMTELYGFWVTIDTEAELKSLYNLEDDVDFYTTSTLDTMLLDYVTSSSLTTTLGDYVLTSALTTTLGGYVETSDLATATVQTAGELAPTKESGVAGFFELFEEDTTNELVWGWRGPSDLSVNISNMPPDAAGAVGQTLVISNVQTGQTLESGKTGTLVTYTNTTVVPTDDGYSSGWDGDTTEIPSKDDIYDKIESLSLSGGAPTFQASDPSVTDTSGLYINTTDGDMFAVNQNTGISTWATTYTPWWLLTVQDPGNGNSITSSGSIDCPGTCSEYVVNNATPTLTKVPTAGYEPLLWTGDATDTSATTNPDTITMDSAKTVGATFNLLPTLDSGAVMSVSNQITLPFTEALTIGLGGSGGIVVTGSITGASDGTYLSGDTTSEFTFLTADNFDPAETITVAYTQPTDGLEDSNGGDLASFSGESVTNGIGGGASVTDDFNRSDGDLGANWTADSIYTGTLRITSSAVASDTYATAAMSYYTGETFSDNQYAQIDLAAELTGYHGCGIRADGSGNGYGLLTAGTASIRIFRIDSGARISLATYTGDYSGQTVRLEGSGTTLTAYADSVELGSITDSTYTTGNPLIYNSENGSTYAIDNFSGGDL